MGGIFSKLFPHSKSRTNAAETTVQPLDYEKIILLDAENLAEQGIAEAYQQLLPELMKYIAHPADLSELLDGDGLGYKIQCDGQEYLIYSAEEPATESESWGRATYFFFLIVNKQLVGTDVQLYAINSGNDLGALFLAPEEAKAVQSVLPRKTDWPYIPILSHSWYGQFH